MAAPPLQTNACIMHHKERRAQKEAAGFARIRGAAGLRWQQALLALGHALAQGSWVGSLQLALRVHCNCTANHCGAILLRGLMVPLLDN